MRIIAGELRSRRLVTPPGVTTRPTTDRARESLFNVLSNLKPLEGTRILDLFAGSGAFGFEALSRGAREVIMVEADRKAIRAIEENIAALDEMGAVRLIAGNVYSRLSNLAGPFDVVYSDAPYEDRKAREALPQMILDSSLLAADGLLIIEHRTGDMPVSPRELRELRQLRAGEASFTIFGREHERE